jgi:hypothetical protein
LLPVSTAGVDAARKALLANAIWMLRHPGFPLDRAFLIAALAGPAWHFRLYRTRSR